MRASDISLSLRKASTGYKDQSVTEFNVCTHGSEACNCRDLARVVRKLDNAIHRINHYPVDSVVCFVNTYPLDSDLSGG